RPHLRLRRRAAGPVATRRAPARAPAPQALGLPRRHPLTARPEGPVPRPDGRSPARPRTGLLADRLRAAARPEQAARDRDVVRPDDPPPHEGLRRPLEPGARSARGTFAARPAPVARVAPAVLLDVAQVVLGARQEGARPPRVQARQLEVDE